MSRRNALGLALGLGAVAIMVAAATAGATHPRPAGATPLRVSLVPSYNSCGSPNRTHGPPLAFPSCNPPTQSSSFLTVGTPDANGAGASSTGTSACGNANSTGGPDYTGELRSEATIRITDHYNSVSAGGGTDTATVRDVPFPVNLVCSNTSSTAIGATCTITGGQPLSIFPDPTHPTRAVVEITQLEVFDGGADGSVATTPNTVFMRQGIFIP
jgi:hypothetical protein